MPEKSISIPQVEKLKNEVGILSISELPSRSALEKYEPQKIWFANSKHAYGTRHDIGHLTRVLILQEIIANSLCASAPSLEIDRESIRWAASTHDVRKQGEYEIRYTRHGVLASEWVKNELAQYDKNISIETIEKVSIINRFHASMKSNLPLPDMLELKILRDADLADALRVADFGVPIIGKSPEIIRNFTFRKLMGTMNFAISRSLLPIAEQFGILSKREGSYDHEPFTTVMDTAENIGLLNP